jgi:hypothetical protein
MQESGKNHPILTKAFEVSYALFRIASNISDAGFAGTIREEATHLMGDVAKEDYIGATRSILAIEYFIKLAAEVNFVSFLNTEIMFREIGNLNAAIAEFSNPAMNAANEEIDISGIFTNPIPVGEQNLFKPSVRPHKEEKENSSMASGIRQAAILEQIRQSGNCRIKDIQDILPDCSERTIRYDLQSLVEQNLIERVGNGGPSVFYRVRQEAKLPIGQSAESIASVSTDQPFLG